MPDRKSSSDLFIDTLFQLKAGEFATLYRTIQTIIYVTGPAGKPICPHPPEKDWNRYAISRTKDVVVYSREEALALHGKHPQCTLPKPQE